MTKETTGTEIQQWELAEMVDDAIASDQWHPAMISEYVYEMKQGGRVINDLTAAAYHQLALNRSISTVNVDREERDKGVIYTVTVRDPNGLEKYGVAYEPYYDSRGNFDKFCLQKALTKATRNAIKQLIDATERINAIHKLKEIGKQKEKP